MHLEPNQRVLVIHVESFYNDDHLYYQKRFVIIPPLQCGDFKLELEIVYCHMASTTINILLISWFCKNFFSFKNTQHACHHVGPSKQEALVIPKIHWSRCNPHCSSQKYLKEFILLMSISKFFDHINTSSTMYLIFLLFMMITHYLTWQPPLQRW